MPSIHSSSILRSSSVQERSEEPDLASVRCAGQVSLYMEASTHDLVSVPDNTTHLQRSGEVDALMNLVAQEGATRCFGHAGGFNVPADWYM